MALTDPVALTQALIRCPSITPREAGGLDLLQGWLTELGFTCHRLTFEAPNTAPVENLYARLGGDGPHLCFAGHMDVVPPGDEAAWTHPPFSGALVDDIVHGRGAADMKGGIACFLAALAGFLTEKSQNLPGAVSFLITCDEEGPAINGTRKVLAWMAERGERPDHAIVGEPTSVAQVGDTIKIGRRGSLNGELTIIGRQGHVAYPHLARNPIPGLLAVLQAYLAAPLDEGTADFAPSNLEVTDITVGNPAVNVIPARATAKFNIRFNDRHSSDSLITALREKTEAILADTGLSHELTFQVSGESFLTARDGHLVRLMAETIAAETGQRPELSTGGGTSDARFIKDMCPVIEVGLRDATIHKVNEQVPVADLHRLTAIYGRFLAMYFSGT